MLNDATIIVDRYKDDQALLAAIKEYLRAYGGLLENHPDVKVILNASLEDLPEYLSSEDRVLRVLAKWRLDTLTDD